MPVSRNKPSMLTIPSATVASIAIPTAAAADQALPSIVIPAYPGSLLAAYLRYAADHFNQVTAGATIDGNQYIQIDNGDGSGYHNALLIPTGSVAAGSAVMMTNGVELQGAVDIKAYCLRGATLAIKWALAKTTAGIQTHYDVHLYLDLVFR